VKMNVTTMRRECTHRRLHVLEPGVANKLSAGPLAGIKAVSPMIVIVGPQIDRVEFGQRAVPEEAVAQLVGPILGLKAQAEWMLHSPQAAASSMHLNGSINLESSAAVRMD